MIAKTKIMPTHVQDVVRPYKRRYVALEARIERLANERLKAWPRRFNRLVAEVGILTPCTWAYIKFFQHISVSSMWAGIGAVLLVTFLVSTYSESRK